MLEFGLDIAAFVIKSLVLVGSILIVVSVVASLALKNKMGEDKFKFTNLSEKLKKTHNKLKLKTLAPKEQKAFKKEQKKQQKKTKEQDHSKQGHLYVLDFNGDMKASAAEHLKKLITQILNLADPQKDEVLLRLESPGGMVSGYGLAASELTRLRDANIPLTIAVDKVAASGGYLMSCVGNQIIASPFAILGSIGVVAGMPNFNKLLKKNHIDYELLTAGKYKRTLTMFGENTDEGREKFVAQLEQIHSLFKNFVKKYRPQLDIEEVATGDYWFGEDALQLKLADKIQTSEDYILESNENKKVFHLDYQEKEKLMDKVIHSASTQIRKSRWNFL